MRKSKVKKSYYFCRFHSGHGYFLYNSLNPKMVLAIFPTYEDVLAYIKLNGLFPFQQELFNFNPFPFNI